MSYDDPRRWGDGEGPNIGTYILKDKDTIERVDTLTWGRWLEAQMRLPNMGLRRVAHHEVGLFRLSSVFLGLDHGLYPFGQKAPGYRPVVFETMMFPRKYSGDLMQLRFTTWRATEAMHMHIVQRLRHLRRATELAYLSGDPKQRAKAIARLVT